MVSWRESPNGQEKMLQGQLVLNIGMIEIQPANPIIML